ncbi:TerB family tellurite resistance protein [Zavarzinia sp. CC-PAN008]|uniref:tellurite resistance TerB family protein n=1 Tax=Zavarzinia sp. CC-PAN008 TaxID=3243332 RepID=UPI003F747405
MLVEPMLDRVLAMLTGQAPRAAPGRQGGLKLAVAALLVEAATIDNGFDAVERQTILDLLRRRFDLDGAEAEGLLQQAWTLQQGSTQVLRFTQAIKDALDEQERIGVLEQVWEVILADGRVDDLEANLMRRLAGLVYVTDRDSGDARKRAEARMAAASRQ